jgi:N-acetylglucosaminyldiphosphoundecaprenol N-acetyl-beta-D-mannosaminyltransferase
LLFGSKPGVAERVAKRFGVEHVLALDGYGYKAEEVVAKCRELDFVPDIALVALGGLLQFQVTRLINEELKPQITVACGGSFDVLSGDVPRAPGWMQRVGLEWAFRVGRQPARIGRLGGVVRGLFLARQAISVADSKKAISVSL